MLHTLPHAVAALIINQLTSTECENLESAFGGHWRPATEGSRRFWLAQKYAAKWLSRTRPLDRGFRTGHFNLAKGELIGLVEEQCGPANFACLLHHWRNGIDLLSRESHPEWMDGTPAYVDTSTRLGAIQAAYPEWQHSWRWQAKFGGVLRLMMAAFQVPRTFKWLTVDCPSLHFLGLGEVLCSTEEAKCELETWEDVLLMVVAHTILLQYDRQAFKARFRRCLERLCRLDLIHLLQTLAFQPRHSPEVHDMVQNDVLAAFAAFEPWVSQAIGNMGPAGIAKVASAVDHIIKGTALKLWNWQAGEEAHSPYTYYPGGFCLPYIWETKRYRPYEPFPDFSGVHLDQWGWEQNPADWEAHPHFPGLDLPEPAQRCVSCYTRSQRYAKRRFLARPARGTARRNACISDFAVY